MLCTGSCSGKNLRHGLVQGISFSVLCSCGMQKGRVVVASHTYSAGNRDWKKKMSLFILISSFLKLILYSSLTIDCCTVSIWVAGPSVQLCMDFLWVCLWQCSLTFLRHFIMLRLKRLFCCLWLNVGLLSHLNGSLGPGTIISIGTFTV